MYNRKKYIKRALAFFLLLIFITALTPKQYLHTCFASHTDIKSFSEQKYNSSLSVSGFNCKCDDQVAESPFIYLEETNILDFLIPRNEIASRSSFIQSIPVFTNSDRGPPTLD